MRRSGRAAGVGTVIGAVLATLLVVAGGAPATAATGVKGAPAASSSPVADTSFAYSSAPGDPLGRGASARFDTDAGATVSVQADTQSVQLYAQDASGSASWQVGLAAGAGDVLRPGIFRQTEEYPSQTGRSPGLSVSGNGLSCTHSTGSFRVNQLGFSAQGFLATLDLTFVYRCGSASTPPFLGTIHYDAYPLSYHQTSAAGDPVGQGRTANDTGSTSVLTVDGVANGFTARVSGLGDEWSIIATAPTGTTWQLGHPYPVSRFGDETHARLDVSGDGSGCNATTGTVTVTALVVEGGKVTHMLASFVQHCDGARPALHGTLHYYA